MIQNLSFVIFTFVMNDKFSIARIIFMRRGTLRYLSAFVATIFLAVPAQSATLITLFNFNGLNGSSPSGSLITDASGTLFGTTFRGGTSGLGTIYKFDKNGALTTLFNFNGSNGQNPNGGVIRDTSGNLFGTTVGGGAGGQGTIFRLGNSGALTTLFSFSGLNGNAPSNNLILDASGNLFGTTRNGGAGGPPPIFSGGQGTVFKLDRTGTLTNFVSFNGSNGALPIGGLTADRSGNLFGTTAIGGSGRGRGTIFRVDQAGVFTTISNINDPNANGPFTNVIVDVSGNLFGTTFSGGQFGSGSIFKLDNAGTFSTLFSFNSQSGLFPTGGLITDASGNLFGTTAFGGANNRGTIFKFDKAGALTTLVSFDDISGSGDNARLIAVAGGKLLGTTVSGGLNRAGIIFSVDIGSVAAVPEPATWAMMLFGFGFVGSALRRRQSRLAARAA
jgi:uncharacterized repeat protein (TIGR03803 family)